MILLTTSVPHTGTYFLRHLLTLHPDISDFVHFRDLPETYKDYEVILDNSVYEQLHTMYDSKYIQLFSHFDHQSLWMKMLIYFRPFKSKLVIPLRHPYLCYRSSIVRDECHRLNSYLEMLLYLNKHHFILPIDILGTKSVNERLYIVKQLFSYLDLEITGDIEDLSRTWKRFNNFEDISFSQEQYTKMRDITEKMCLFDILKKHGFDYYKEDFDVIQ